MPRRPQLRLLLGSALSCIAFAGSASAATIHVPADYPTIYAALDAAQFGDVVEVAPGTYSDFDTRPVWNTNNVSAVGFLKDGVTLRSSGGAASTILRIDAGPDQPAVLFAGSIDAVVEGFTFTGSAPGLYAIIEEVIDGKSGSLSVTGCIFRDIGQGDVFPPQRAITTYNGTVTIDECIFQDIDSPPTPVVTIDFGSLTVEDSQFLRCTGGGIYVFDQTTESVTIIRRSEFRDVAMSDGFGPLSLRSFTAVVENSIFSERDDVVDPVEVSIQCGWYTGELAVRGCTFGPGIECDAWASSVEVSGNTFYGGGQSEELLLVYGFDPPNVQLQLNNNVFSSTTQEAAVQTFGADVHTSCNVFWDNFGGNTEGFALSETDFIADPMFCDPENDNYFVHVESICLPWNNGVCGQIGAWPTGCGVVSVEPSTWGKIKGSYR